MSAIIVRFLYALALAVPIIGQKRTTKKCMHNLGLRALIGQQNSRWRNVHWTTLLHDTISTYTIRKVVLGNQGGQDEQAFYWTRCLPRMR